MYVHEEMMDFPFKILLCPQQGDIYESVRPIISTNL